MPRTNKTKKMNAKKSKSTSNQSAGKIAADVGRAIAKSLIVSAGTKAGGAVGGPVGAMLGGTIASKLSRIIGAGDYVTGDRPVSNSLFKSTSSTSAAFGEASRSMRFRRREFIKNVSAVPDTFSVDVVVVQPGLTEPFPYLSNLARCFTKYKLHGLVYEFVSNVSPYSTTAAMGSLVMAFDPNQGNATPSNKVAMENLFGSASARPDRNMVYGVECKSSDQPFQQYFVRSGDTPWQTDAVEDFGRFFLAQSQLPSSSYPDGSLLGELWVTYDIELIEPRLPTLESGTFAFCGIGAAGLYVASFSDLSSPRYNKNGLLFDTYLIGNDVVLHNVPIGSVCVMVLTINSTSAYVPTFTGDGVVDYPYFSTTQTGTTVTYASTYITTGYQSRNCAMFAFTVTGNASMSVSPRIDVNFGASGAVPGQQEVSLYIYTLGQSQPFRSDGML